MNKFATVSLLSLGLFLAGCASNVKYADLNPFTTATLNDHKVTIHLGTDMANSACYTHPRTKVVAGTVYVSGRRTLQEQKREVEVRLSKSINSQSVVVVWVEPDGRLVPLPLIR